MRKALLLFSTLSLANLSIAQVGINTQNPQGVFNIDGEKDNPLSGSAHTQSQQLNDFVITKSGNVGIGNINPSRKLEIHTEGTNSYPVAGFKLVDGTQNAGYALTSDSNGVGTWQPIKIEFKSLSPIGHENYILPASTSVPKYTGVTVSIPPGKWIIDFVVPIRTKADITYNYGSQFPRLRLLDTADESTYTVDSFSADSVRPRLVSASMSNAQDLAFMVGSLGIYNQTMANKNYYLVADNFFSNGNGTAYRKSLEFVFDNWNEASITLMRITE